MASYKSLRIAVAFGIFIATLSGIQHSALAACTSPAGIAGGITWNGTDSVIWCDGTNWYALKNTAGSSGSAGYIQFSDGSGGFASDSGLNWDNTNKRLGINVSSPSSDLSFGGGANRMIGMTSRSGDGDGFSLTIRSGATSSGATDRNGGPLYLSSGVATGTGSSAIYFRTATPQGSTNTTSNTPTDKMTILGNGNVGIGTTTPVSALTIGETGNASGEVAANTIRSGSGGRYGIGFNTGVAGTFNLFGHSTAQQIGIGFDTGSFGTFNSVVTVKPSGNVGIGTTAPTYKLHIVDDAANTSGSDWRIGSYAAQNVNPLSASSSTFSGLEAIGYTNGSASITTMYGGRGAVTTSSTNAITNALGWAGVTYVPTASPITNAYGMKGEVRTNHASASVTNAYAGSFAVTNTLGTITNGMGVHIGTIQGTNKWGLYVSDSTANNYFAGNVGIGTASPTTPLSVSTAQGTSGGILVADATDANNPRVQLRTSNPNGNGVIEVLDNTEAVKIQLHGNGASYINSGNLGIGTTTPGSALQVYGNAAVSDTSGTITNGGYLLRLYSTTNMNGLNLYYQNADVNGAALTLQKYKSGGSELAAGDTIGVIDFFGTTGAGSALRAAQIRATAETGWSGTGDAPGRLTFWTTPDGSSTAVERMRIDNAGNVGIGTTTPAGTLHVTGTTFVPFDRYGSPGSHLALRSANGTAGSPTALTNGDVTGQLTFQGYTGSAFTTSHQTGIIGYAAENWSGTNQGDILTFRTTPTGSTTSAERMRIDSSGNVGIGTASPTSTLHILDTATNTSGSDWRYGTYVLQNINPASASSSTFSGFESFALTNGSSNIGKIHGGRGSAQTAGTNAITEAVGWAGVAYVPSGSTITNAFGSTGQVRTNHASATVTNAYGIHSAVTDTLGTITNGYGVYIGAVQATNNWGLYSGDGTADNYFAGNVGIGRTTPAAKLDVNGFMRLAKNGSAPATCDATIDGAIALTSARRMCVCDATSWKEVNSATVCTW